jgi:hypothetical protein
MKVLISAHRTILLDVQGSNIVGLFSFNRRFWCWCRFDATLVVRSAGPGMHYFCLQSPYSANISPSIDFQQWCRHLGCPWEYSICTWRSLCSAYIFYLWDGSLTITIPKIVPFSILIGLVVPIPFWLLHKYYPRLGTRHVVTPILCCKELLDPNSYVFANEWCV